MIQVCPNCGYHLYRELNDGLTHCAHCNQIFDSSDFNKLLSAAWMVRNQHCDAEQIKEKTDLDDDLAVFVFIFVNHMEYNHEDFSALLKKLGVARKAYLNSA
jgi:hypothetical protein